MTDDKEVSVVLVRDVVPESHAVIDDLVAVLSEVESVLIGITNETEPHIFGRPQYDAKLDDIHERCMLALNAISFAHEWGNY